MPMLFTDRLHLRQPEIADAEFFVRLLNDPDWLRYIGDRGVRTASDAAAYIEDRLLDSFRRFGFGLWVVETRSDGRAVGICGLLRRDTLDDVDLGFAFLPEARGQGYAVESGKFVLDLAAADYALTRVVAITVIENEPSARVLERLGMSFERTIENDDHPLLRLFSIELDGMQKHLGLSK